MVQGDNLEIYFSLTLLHALLPFVLITFQFQKMEDINEIRRSVNLVKDKCLNLKGLTYKMTTEKTVSEEKMRIVNTVNDEITDKMNTILGCVSNIETRLKSSSTDTKSFKKNLLSIRDEGQRLSWRHHVRPVKIHSVAKHQSSKQV